MYKNRLPHARHWRESPFHKGNLKYVILDLIREKPRYGYEIIRTLEERSQGMYAPSAGAIYPTLQMLEEMGFASSTQTEGKKVYTITDAGLRFMVEQGEQTEEVKERIKDHWDSEHVSERRKVMNQVREMWLLIGHGFPDMPPGKKEKITYLLERTCNEIKTIIEQP